MKERIVVVGCGEHARMTIDNIEEQALYDIFGLIAASPVEVGSRICGYTVVCADDALPSMLAEHRDVTGYILGVGAVGGMKARAAIYAKVDQLLPAVNVIHPTAVLSSRASIGSGNLIEAYTKIANGARMGRHCILNTFSAINHDQLLGDNVLIGGNVSLAGTSIGDHSVIADGASIGFKRRVGANCIIADGAVVTRDVPDDMIAFGNPARIIKRHD